MSLRGRLVAIIILILAAGILIADITAFLALRSHLSARNDRALEVAASHIHQAEGRTVNGQNALQSLIPQSLFVGLLDEHGAVVATSQPTGATGSGWQQTTLGTLQPGKPTTLSRGPGRADDYRMLAVPVHGSGVEVRVGGATRTVTTVVVGIPLEADAEALATLLRVEVLGGLAVLVVGALAALLALGLGLRPLRVVADTARAIEAGDHRERIPWADEATEMGRLIAALNAAFDSRSNSEERIRDFVADASHELRTPLAAVSGWADLYLSGGLPGAGDVDTAMTAVATESARMKRLVDDLLALARLDGGQAPNYEHVDLSAMAASIVSELTPIFPEHPTETTDNGPVPVAGDRELLYRCLRNLIVNAYRHTPAGTFVHVNVQARPGLAIAEIRDTGPGFPAGTEKRAFDRFWRADVGRERTGPGGSGLGLAIARQIAVTHGGDLTLTSTPGQGATLSLVLPETHVPDLQPTDSNPSAGPHPDLSRSRARSGVMTAMDRIARAFKALPSMPVRHPIITMLAWLAIAASTVFAATAVGSQYTDDVGISDTNSARGATLIGASDGATSDLVVHTSGAPLKDQQAELEEALARVAKVEGVKAVGEPLYSEDGQAARVTVTLTEPPSNFGTPLVDDLDDAVRPLTTDGIKVDYAGDLGAVADQRHSGVERAEAFGFLAAFIVLLLTFGSVLAAALPLITAASGLVVGLSALGLASSMWDFSTTSPSLAIMIGLGAGIDYALFIVTRSRQHLLDGHSPREAASHALRSSGRAVLVASGTVLVALFGLYASGIVFVGQLGLAAAFTVLTAAFSAVTLVPAAVTLLGRRIDRIKIRRPVAEPPNNGRGWYRWATLVSGRPWPFLVGGLFVLAVLAAPILDMRVGYIDPGGARPVGATSRDAYDVTADQFGAGANGTFVVAVDAKSASVSTTELHDELASEPGVASVSPFVPAGKSGVQTANVTPTTSPMSGETRDLFERLTDKLDGTGAFLTGTTAAHLEVGQRFIDRLPLIMLTVLTASFLLLLVNFRSLVLATKAAVLNLFSIGAAYGVVVAVFQWGWGDHLLGVGQPVPVTFYVPMMMFAIVFGLSMDYEVFLLSRVREAWLRTGRNTESVAEGLAATARVITSAALVMISVFLAFAGNDDVVIKMLAVGLGVSVAVDATIVRLVLVPATMAIFGKANWWCPAWLERLLPGRSSQAH